MRLLQLLLCLFLSCGLPLQAKQAELVFTPQDVPNVQLADSTKLLSDPQAYLSEEEQGRLNEALRSVRSRYGVEFVVVLIPSIGDRDIESFSTELFRLWGLGDKKANDGLLLVLALEDKRMRFEVGYGLEALMTDAQSGRIWREAMQASLRSGSYAQGIAQGISEVTKLLEASEKRADGKRTLPDEEDNASQFFFSLYLIIGLGISLIAITELSLKLKSIHSAEQARRELPALKTTLDVYFWLILCFCFPLTLVLLWWRTGKLKDIQRLASTCPHCQRQAMRQNLSSITLNEHLNPYQRTEQALATRLFSLWICDACSTSELASRATGKAPYKACPHCHSLAFTPQQRQAFRQPSGATIIRTTSRCQACGYEDIEDEPFDDGDDFATAATIGTILSIGRAVNSRGGFGGGFSGGSFGGGSSGGGGYSGSW